MFGLSKPIINSGVKNLFANNDTKQEDNKDNLLVKISKMFLLFVEERMKNNPQDNKAINMNDVINSQNNKFEKNKLFIGKT